jgi:hypothetical protein
MAIARTQHGFPMHRTVTWLGAFVAATACADATVAPSGPATTDPKLSVAEKTTSQGSSIRSKRVRQIRAPIVYGERVNGSAAEAMLRASLEQAIRGGPRLERAFSITTMSADGTPRSLTPREYLAILDREAGRATARVARASSSSGWDFDGIAADETSQTVTVNPYNSVLPSGGQFAMSSRTTASANGSPDPNRGAVQFSHVTHSGSYKVMVGGVEIYSGTLSAGGGSIPAGGGSNTTNWPTVDVGTYCTIDAAMTMSHAAYYRYQNDPLVDPMTLDPIPPQAKTAPGVGAGQLKHPCDDADNIVWDGDYCDDETNPECNLGPTGTRSGSGTSTVMFSATNSQTLVCTATDWYEQTCSGGQCNAPVYVETTYSDCHWE